jgi:hypothetical protein
VLYARDTCDVTSCDRKTLSGPRLRTPSGLHQLATENSKDEDAPPPRTRDVPTTRTRASSTCHTKLYQTPPPRPLPHVLSQEQAFPVCVRGAGLP